MRRRADDDGLVDVELVEVDAEDLRASRPGLRARLELAGAPLPGDAVAVSEPPPDRPVRTRHVARAVGLGVAVVVTGAVVAANLTEANREAELRAALADAPGLLEPLGLVPDQLWVDDDVRPVAAAGDVVLMAAPALQAVDAQDGAVAWTLPSAPEGAQRSCLGLQLTHSPDAVLCSTATPGGAVTDAVVLDAETGAELRAVRLPGMLLDQAERDDDVLSVLAQPDGSVVVVRWGAVSGEQRWRYRSPERVVGQNGSGVGLLRWGSSELALGARLWLTVDLATGRETRAVAGGAGELGWSEEVQLAGDARAGWRAGLANLGGAFRGGAVTDGDGTPRFTLEGPAWQSAIDDGSVPGVLLMTDADGRLQGLDTETGDVRWAGQVLVRQELLRLDGVAVVRDPAAVVAIRISDGVELWRAPASGWTEPLTDGELVLVQGQDVDGRFLSARRLEDGEEVWRLPVPVDVEPRALGGHLLLVGRLAVTAIG